MVETFKRSVAVVVGLFLLVGGVAGWLLREDPNAQMAGEVLVNLVGALVGTGVAWVAQWRKQEPLQAKQIVYASIGGACALWIVLLAVLDRSGLVAALGSGVGGGLVIGGLLALIAYGIRGPIEEAEA